jgi:hypothetical protein
MWPAGLQFESSWIEVACTRCGFMRRSGQPTFFKLNSAWGEAASHTAPVSFQAGITTHTTCILWSCGLWHLEPKDRGREGGGVVRTHDERNCRPTYQTEWLHCAGLCIAARNCTAQDCASRKKKESLNIILQIHLSDHWCSKSNALIQA